MSQISVTLDTLPPERLAQLCQAMALADLLREGEGLDGQNSQQPDLVLQNGLRKREALSRVKGRWELCLKSFTVKELKAILLLGFGVTVPDIHKPYHLNLLKSVLTGRVPVTCFWQAVKLHDSVASVYFQSCLLPIRIWWLVRLCVACQCAAISCI